MWQQGNEEGNYAMMRESKENVNKDGGILHSLIILPIFYVTG